MAKINVQMDNMEELKLEKKAQVKTKKVKETKNKKSKSEKNNNQKKISFFGQIKAEMKPVTWPTKKNMIKYSIATIVMVILLALFFVGLSALFDLLYAFVQGWIG